jgi:HPt (histidine-containing phosphotransfer) domain-containing protein
MNRNMNLPAIQRIAMEFERENDMMDQRQEMMGDAVDDAFEDEEEETDEIVNQVLDEIGIDLSQSVCFPIPSLCALVLTRSGSLERRLSRRLINRRRRINGSLRRLVVGRMMTCRRG